MKPNAVAVFYLTASLFGVFSRLLAFAIEGMTDLFEANGWQQILIIGGLVPVSSPSPGSFFQRRG